MIAMGIAYRVGSGVRENEAAEGETRRLLKLLEPELRVLQILSQLSKVGPIIILKTFGRIPVFGQDM